MKKIIVTSLLIILISLGASCDDEDVYKGRLSEKYIEYSTKGVRVASRYKINNGLLPLIDQGLDDLFRIASNPPNSYEIPRTHSDYNVWLLPRSNKCISPGFLVDATGSPYEGSEYDKDPSPDRCLICAAGMTIFTGTIGNPERPGMIIVDDPGTVRLVTRYEGEHSLLFYVDRPRYNATMYHPPPHPILIDGEQGIIVDGKFRSVTEDYKGKKVCALIVK